MRKKKNVRLACSSSSQCHKSNDGPWRVSLPRPPECRVNAYALCPITVIPVSQSSACQKHAKIQSYFSRGNIQRISLSFFMPHSSSSSILMTIIMRNIFSFFLSKTLSREIEKRWRWMMGNNNHNSTHAFVRSPGVLLPFFWEKATAHYYYRLGFERAYSPNQATLGDFQKLQYSFFSDRLNWFLFSQWGMTPVVSFSSSSSDKMKGEGPIQQKGSGFKAKEIFRSIIALAFLSWAQFSPPGYHAACTDLCFPLRVPWSDLASQQREIKELLTMACWLVFRKGIFERGNKMRFFFLFYYLRGQSWISPDQTRLSRTFNSK